MAEFFPDNLSWIGPAAGQIILFSILVPLILSISRHMQLRRVRSILLTNIIRYAHIKSLVFERIVTFAWEEGDIVEAVAAFQLFDDLRIHYQRQTAIYGFGINSAFAKSMPDAMASESALLRSVLVLSARKHSLSSDQLIAVLRGYDEEYADKTDAAEVADRILQSLLRQAIAIERIHRHCKYLLLGSRLPDLYFPSGDFAKAKTMKQLVAALNKNAHQAAFKLSGSDGAQVNFSQEIKFLMAQARSKISRGNIPLDGP